MEIYQIDLQLYASASDYETIWKPQIEKEINWNQNRDWNDIQLAHSKIVTSQYTEISRLHEKTQFNNTTN